MPQTGRVLLEAPGRIAASPDGHGGMLAAMLRSGALDDIERRGIRHLFYFQVDNPLVDICGREFVGYHLLAGSEFSTPGDRQARSAGAGGQRGAGRRPADGDRVQRPARRGRQPPQRRRLAGDLGGQHRRSRDRRRLAAATAAGMVIFGEVGKVGKWMPPACRSTSPTRKWPTSTPRAIASSRREPNAIKFERFIFDLMPQARNAIVVEVDPALAFAPLKNASGAKDDTPESVRSQLSALHRDWLRQAGAEVADDVPVEISPLYRAGCRGVEGEDSSPARGSRSRRTSADSDVASLRTPARVPLLRRAVPA